MWLQTNNLHEKIKQEVTIRVTKTVGKVKDYLLKIPTIVFAPNFTFFYT